MNAPTPSNPDQSLFARLRKAAENRVVAAGLTVAAGTGMANIAQAEGATKDKVTNVFALTGGLGGDLGPGTQVEVQTFSVDGNSQLKVNTKVSKSVGQKAVSEMAATGYFKIHFEGKDYIVQQEAVTGELHGYEIDTTDNNVGQSKNGSDFILTGFNTGNFLGTGDNQFITIDYQSGTIKTWELTKGADGKMGQKLVATSEQPLLKSDSMVSTAAQGNNFAAVNADLNTVFTMKKGKDGKWTLDKKKEFSGEPGAVVGWDSVIENGIHTGPNGSFYLVVTRAEDFARLLLDSNLDIVTELGDTNFMTLGEDGKYALLEENGKYYIKKTGDLKNKDSKGIPVAITNPISTGLNSAQRTGANGETTYYVKGENEVVIFNIKEGNPPVVSLKTLKLSSDVPSFLHSELIVFSDNDKDGVYGGDNCPVPNPNQADGNKDGVGDACDPKLWGMSWKKLPGVNAQFGCDDTASEPTIKPITGGVEFDFTSSGKIGLQPAGVPNESGNIQVRVLKGFSITIETSEGTVTKDGKEISGSMTCANDTIFKVSSSATVKITVVAGTSVQPDIDPTKPDAAAGEDTQPEKDAGSPKEDTGSPKPDAGSSDSGNSGADAGSADNGSDTSSPKPDAAQQADTNGPSIGTPKAPPEGCNASPTSPITAAEGILRITAPIAGLALLRAGLRRRKEEEA